VLQVFVWYLKLSVTCTHMTYYGLGMQERDKKKVNNFYKDDFAMHNFYKCLFFHH